MRSEKIAETRVKFKKSGKIALEGPNFLKKNSQKDFLLKFNLRVSREFETKRDNFQVKRMSIQSGKKLNSFTQRDKLFFQPGNDE